MSATDTEEKNLNLHTPGHGKNKQRVLTAQNSTTARQTDISSTP
jgi:hypothetical protein